ncbi:unnamed protein product [Effrenium voratum]|nr:unnamed protein product [Effrenium voratum]|mmetsp:Transcript_131227/g.311237  ORF Transcript_131227/g.311237 Transcript_131227/m.311237 type:complete len:218 (-) Transcript_131227:78-731(-)
MEYIHYPVQVGKGTGTRTQFYWMGGLVFLQAVLTVVRLICLFDTLGGFFMGVVVYLGWYALKKQLDVTFVCCWGFASGLLLFYDAFGALTGTIINTFRLDFTRVAILLALPICDFLAANFAWDMFKEHERQGGLFKPLFATKDPEVGKAAGYGAQVYGAPANVPLPQKPGYQYPDYDMQSLGPYQNTGGPSPYNTGYRQDMYPPDVKAPRKHGMACC